MYISMTIMALLWIFFKSHPEKMLEKALENLKKSNENEYIKFQDTVYKSLNSALHNIGTEGYTKL